MKKLFTLIALVAVALGASAQKSVVMQKMIKPISVQQFVKAAPVKKADINLANRSEVVAKTVVADQVSGSYIEINNNTDPIECSTASISIDANNTATLVLLQNSFPATTVTGTYDPEAGTITISNQEIPYNWQDYFAEDPGKAEFRGFNLTQEGDFDFSEGQTVLVYDAEQKAFTSKCDGYLVYLPDYNSGKGTFVAYNIGKLAKPNAYQSELHQVSKGWQKVQYPVYIEEEEGQVNVYNWDEVGVASIYVNEDLTVGAPNVQLLISQEFEDPDTYGQGFYLVNCKWEAITDSTGYINFVYDDTMIMGKMQGNIISMYETDPNNLDGYWGLISLLDADGAGYLYTRAAVTNIILNEGVYANGIKDVKSIASKASETKCYNMLGQKTTRGAKGLVIAGGKKFFNK